MGITKKSILDALDNAHDGFMISDQKGTILYFNHAYLELTGLKEIIAIGDNIQRYIDLGYIKGASCLEAIKQRKSISQVHLEFEKNTAIISMSKPEFDEDDDVIRVITNVRDVTEFINLKNDIEEVQIIMDKFSADIDKYNECGKGIIAVDDKMRSVLDTAKRISTVDITLMIQGESGTGKEVLARYIHENSNRKNKPFVAVNCGAIPESLLETELFGYAEGTFTGQIKGGKKGLFATAENGTLFLDEIGDMPFNLQVKLLRVLENKSYVPVGSSTEIKTDVRIISATNQNLHQMVVNNKFREDLYYRLNVVSLEIPALRNRSEDIIPLSMFFLETFNRKYNCNKKITMVVMKKLKEYSWPGNVRELKNMIEKMTVMSAGRELEIPSNWGKKSFKDGEIQNVFEHGDNLSLEKYMNEKEKQYLKKEYARCGTTRRLAEVLEVNHSTVIRKLKKYGINANRK